ncbi:MAG: response regulator [Nitrospirae bacterium]|nr:response regulator [Nitrospirota bacterium]
METYTPDTEEYEEELRSALICEDNTALKSSVSAAIEGLKYNVEFAADAEDGFQKLKFNQYGLLVLDERFGGSTPESSGIYKLLLTMPMSTRRNIFFVLIGKNLKTADSMTAFSKSANLVVNEKDIANLKTILKKAVADNDQFYKVFRERLRKKGQQ